MSIAIKCPVRQSEHFVKSWNNRFITDYTYNAYQPNMSPKIILQAKEFVYIQSPARALRTLGTTLLKRIISIAE